MFNICKKCGGDIPDNQGLFMCPACHKKQFARLPLKHKLDLINYRHINTDREIHRLFNEKQIDNLLNSGVIRVDSNGLYFY